VVKRLASFGIAGIEGAAAGLCVFVLTLALAGAVLLAWIGLANGSTPNLSSLAGRSQASVSGSATLRVFGTPAQQQKVRAALDDLVLPADTSAFSVVVKSADDLPLGTEAMYSYPASVISLSRDVVDGAYRAQTSYVLAHEIGHMFECVYLDHQGRSEFMRLRGFAEGTKWDDERAPWNQRPAEDFAEVYAAFAAPRGGMQIRTDAGPLSNPTAIESLIERYGLGPALGTPGQVETAFSVARKIADTAQSDRVIGSALLSLALICAIYGAGDAVKNLSRRADQAKRYADSQLRPHRIRHHGA